MISQDSYISIKKCARILSIVPESFTFLDRELQAVGLAMPGVSILGLLLGRAHSFLLTTPW